MKKSRGCNQNRVQIIRVNIQMTTWALTRSQIFYLVKLNLDDCHSEFSEFSQDLPETFGVTHEILTL